MMRDGIGYRSIPVFTGALAFLPACNDGVTTATGDDESGDTTVATDESSDGTPPTSADQTTNGESAESGDPQCGGTGSCGAVPPVGWFGPVVYARVQAGQEAPSCPPEVSDVGPILADGFVDPGPAVCGCECQLTQPINCYSYIIGAGGGYDTGYYGSESGYFGESGGYVSGGPGTGYYGTGYVGTGYVGTGYVGTGYVGTGYVGTGYVGTGGYSDSGYGGGCYGGYDYVGDACTNIAINGLVRFDSYDYDYGGGGVCEETAIVEIPQFAWAATIATCRIPDTALLCGDDGVCIPPAPEGFESQWCMYQQGDLECPAGPYPNKTVFWSDVDDTRDCSNCGCGSTGSSCEDAELLVFEQPDCAGEPVLILPSDNQCIEVIGASVSADFGSAEACPVTEESVSEGSIAPTGPFTFCCSD